MLRAPVSPELASVLLSADDAAAKAVRGFVAVVRDERLQLAHSQGLGIVARTPSALDRIEAALAAQWQVQGGFEQADIDAAIDIDRRLARGALAQQLHGDRIAPQPAWDVDLRIDIPLAAHAPIEPRAAVAEPLPGGGLQLWVGSQDVFYQRDVVARRLRLGRRPGDRARPARRRRLRRQDDLHRRAGSRVLAQALNAPVKVQWTRAQELQYGFHRPPSSHRLRARLEDGQLVDWWHAFASSHILFTNAVVPAWMQRFTDLIGDDGVARGAQLPYRAQAKRVEFDLVRLPVLTGPWRGLGAGPNGLAIESAIDECARQAGADPLRFRLAQVDDPRLARVLERVAEASGWSAPRAASPVGWRGGRGVACGIYKGLSYVAVVAELQVASASGEVRVTRMWCAHDCGRVLNPDQVRAQCEGNLVWGLGMLLTDRLPVAGSRIAATSFADAPVPRFDQVPPIEVLLVDAGDAPSGAGETAIVAAAAALANAVRDATGVRPTRFPLDPATLKA